jgi:hypothetical protein
MFRLVESCGGVQLGSLAFGLWLLAVGQTSSAALFRLTASG